MNDHIDPTKMTIVGAMTDDELPPSVRHRVVGKRRWEDLGSQIREASEQGKWLAVQMPEKTNLEVLRSSVGTELKRYDLKLTTRWNQNDDGSVTMYLKAVAKEK